MRNFSAYTIINTTNESKTVKKGSPALNGFALKTVFKEGIDALIRTCRKIYLQSPLKQFFDLNRNKDNR
jgi:hypothetical protein